MKKILVIEDESSLREGIRDVLSFEGYEVLEAENGIFGYQMTVGLMPDLILCDIMMPEMDGYDLLRLVRKNEDTKLIPFVFLTALAERADIRAGMELGSDDYISKPFTREELIRVVETRLKKAGEIKERADIALTELRNNIITRFPHELRTPLNGILGYGQMLKDYPESFTPAELPKIGNDIYLSAVRLYRLIENYLIYVRLELMKSDQIVKFELNNPDEICKKEAFKVAKNHSRLLDLELTILKGVVFIPQLDFAKIVEELLDNAFKFSAEGTQVSLKGSFVSGKFILTVEDHGRGMTLTDIKKIEAFMQFDRPIYEQQGSGLGLIIVKRIVELYKGLFKIDNKEEGGLLFTVELPGRESK
ncbi:MAG: hybrid sensor histidine kinase/response regulator [Mariniphaga sp.]